MLRRKQNPLNAHTQPPAGRLSSIGPSKPQRTQPQRAPRLGKRVLQGIRTHASHPKLGTLGHQAPVPFSSCLIQRRVMGAKTSPGRRPCSCPVYGLGLSIFVLFCVRQSSTALLAPHIQFNSTALRKCQWVVKARHSRQDSQCLRVTHTYHPSTGRMDDARSASRQILASEYPSIPCLLVSFCSSSYGSAWFSLCTNDFNERREHTVKDIPKC